MRRGHDRAAARRGSRAARDPSARPSPNRNSDDEDDKPRKLVNPANVIPNDDPRFLAIDAEVFKEIPEDMPEGKKEKLIKERKALAEALKEELRMPHYKSMMRRMFAFRNFRKNEEGVFEEKTDMGRIKKANFSLGKSSQNTSNEYAVVMQQSENRLDHRLRVRN